MDTGVASSEGVVISTVGWVITGVAVWLAVSVVTAVLVAGMIRRRDRQVPTDLPGFTADGHLSGIPEQGGPLRVRGAAGRVRRDRD